MQFTAKARFIRFSPYKLRPLADVIRGKNAVYAVNFLSTYAVKKSIPVKKAIESAIANAKSSSEISPDMLVIKEIRIDQGPMVKYFKPGAMGRSNVYRKRMSHIGVVLESTERKEV